jgi:hypothetical protein
MQNMGYFVHRIGVVVFFVFVCCEGKKEVWVDGWRGEE